MSSTAVGSLDARAAEVRRVLHIMLTVSLVLVAAKTAAGVATGSLSILGGAFDSGLDVMTTLAAIALARVAAAEPDEQHPYGHEKFEALGALAMVDFLSISVFEEEVRRRLGARRVVVHVEPRSAVPEPALSQGASA